MLIEYVFCCGRLFSDNHRFFAFTQKTILLIRTDRSQSVKFSNTCHPGGLRMECLRHLINGPPSNMSHFSTITIIKLQVSNLKKKDLQQGLTYYKMRDSSQPDILIGAVHIQPISSTHAIVFTLPTEILTELSRMTFSNL